MIEIKLALQMAPSELTPFNELSPLDSLEFIASELNLVDYLLTETKFYTKALLRWVTAKLCVRSKNVQFQLLLL